MVGLSEEPLADETLNEVIQFIRDSNPFSQHVWGWDMGRFIDWRWGSNNIRAKGKPDWFGDACRIFRDGKRIRAVAKRLGYSPNVHAQGPARGRSNMLGFIVPDLRGTLLMEVVEGAERALHELGYRAMLFHTEWEYEAEVAHIEFMRASRIGGAILCLVRVMQCLKHPEEDAFALGDFDWVRAALLCVAMIGYGLVFESLGFVLSTATFLGTGFFVLGERRLLLLTILPIAFSLLFWLVMTRLLGMYLAPGNLV